MALAFSVCLTLVTETLKAIPIEESLHKTLAPVWPGAPKPRWTLPVEVDLVSLPLSSQVRSCSHCKDCCMDSHWGGGPGVPYRQAVFYLVPSHMSDKCGRLGRECLTI